jgi:hypothetical protein
MVLTEDDYIEFLKNIDQNKLHHRIVRAFAGTSLLFLGYRLEDLSFRTIFKGLINAAARVLKRLSISVQITPKREAETRINKALDSIKELAKKWDQQVGQSYFKEVEKVVERIKKRLSEHKVFSEIIQLENKLNILAVKYEESRAQVSPKDRDEQDSGAVHTVFGRINTLQDAIRKLHRAVNAKEYLKEYFKQIDITIYWGSVQDFTKELRDKCAKEGIIKS